MKERNFNDQARIKLNEKGLQRFEEIVNAAANNDMMSDYGKATAVQELRRRLDGEGYLTDNLNTIMGDYDVSCFESSELTMRDILSSECYSLDMNDEVTVKLNITGVRRTLKRLAEIEKDESLTSDDKRSMIDDIESRIDDDNNLTASLGYIVSNYSDACLETQVFRVLVEPSVTRGAK